MKSLPEVYARSARCRDLSLYNRATGGLIGEILDMRVQRRAVESTSVVERQGIAERERAHDGTDPDTKRAKWRQRRTSQALTATERAATLIRAGFHRLRLELLCQR